MSLTYDIWDDIWSGDDETTRRHSTLLCSLARYPDSEKAWAFWSYWISKWISGACPRIFRQKVVWFLWNVP